MSDLETMARECAEKIARYHFRRSHSEFELQQIKATLERATESLRSELEREKNDRADAHKGWNAANDVIAQLRTELAEARSELEKWKEGCQVNADALRDMGRRADSNRLDAVELRAELAEARRDKERLDWLANPAIDGGTNFVIYNQKGWEPMRILGSATCYYFKHGQGWFPSLREAIDAAMSAHEKEEGV